MARKLEPIELLEPVYARDEPSMTTFGFRLSSFFRKRDSGCKPSAASLPFQFSSFRWCVEVFARGAGSSVGTHVSVFLCIISKLSHGVSVEVPMSMSVLRTEPGIDAGLHIMKGSTDSARPGQVFARGTRRLGWPDLIPLSDITSFLDGAEGLLIHVSLGKPARVTFQHALSRQVIGQPESFDTPAFKIAQRQCFLRSIPMSEYEDGVFVSLHLVFDTSPSQDAASQQLEERPSR